MTPEWLFLLADRSGTFVFALSGGVAAVRRDMDIFGVIMMALLPAVGGGTLRDLLLGQPVFWLDDPAILVIAGTGGVVAFFASNAVDAWKPLRWADAAGLALFAVTGSAKAGDLGHGLVIMVMMGVITATFGGVLRDVVTNREPLILKDDIYATAAVLGALVYAGLAASPATEAMAFLGGLLAAFSLRGAAILFKLSLPRARR